MISLLKDLILQSGEQLKTVILVMEQIRLLKLSHDEREQKFQSVLEENSVKVLICYRLGNHL